MTRVRLYLFPSAQISSRIVFLLPLLLGCVLTAADRIWSYSLVCDKHLNQEDADEDDGSTADIMFEHGQIQGSVLERGK